jgi:hypothetical protein
MLRLPACSVRLGLVLLASALWTVLIVPARAQEPKFVQIKGKIKEMQGERFQVIDDKTMVVSGVDVLPRSEVKIEGEAELGCLQPGLAVTFVANLNNLNAAPEPLKEITICEITEENKEIKVLDDPTKSAAKGKDAVNKYMVRGIIKTLKKNKFVVTVTSMREGVKPESIKGELADDVKVKVLFTSLAYASEGDAVVLSGFSQVEGEVKARKLDVKLANVVQSDKVGKSAGPKKKVPMPRGRTAAAKPDAK